MNDEHESGCPGGMKCGMKPPFSEDDEHPFAPTKNLPRCRQCGVYCTCSIIERRIVEAMKAARIDEHKQAAARVAKADRVRIDAGAQRTLIIRPVDADYPGAYLFPPTAIAAAGGES